MGRVVYLDTDRVCAADIDGVAPGDTVVAHDTAVLDTAVPGQLRLVPSWRDVAVRQRVHADLDRVDRLADATDARLRDAMVVARYELALALAPVLHRLWTIAGSLGGSTVTELEWRIGAQDRPPPSAGVIDAVRARAEALGTRLVVRWSSGPPVPPAGRIRARTRRARTATRRLRPVLGPRAQPAPGGGPWFVEHYPTGARVARRVAAVLPGAVIVSTSPEATEAIEGGETLREAAGLLARRHRAAVVLGRVTRARPRRRLTELATGGNGPWPGDRPAVGETVERVLAEADSWLAGARAALRSTTPAVVATTSYTALPARAAVLAARDRGIATVYVQHALLFEHNEGHHLLHDRYAVWGERDRRRLERYGVPPDRVEVTGNPLLDELAEQGVDGGERRATGPPCDVLYLASRTGGSLVTAEAARAALDAVRRAVERSGRDLLVKVHPLDRSAIFAALPARQVDRTTPSTDLIRSASTVVASTSTAGLEACALDRDLVVLRIAGVAVPDLYAEHGAARLVDDEEDLARELGTLTTDPGARRALAAGRRRLVDDALNGLAGDAAGRVAAVVAAAGRRA